MNVPYRDEEINGGVKRVYWPRGDAEDVKRAIRRDVKSLVGKKGKPYSRDDQRKITAERWGELCESHPQWPGGK